jgi:hypothetical protein
VRVLGTAGAPLPVDGRKILRQGDTRVKTGSTTATHRYARQRLPIILAGHGSLVPQLRSNDRVIRSCKLNHRCICRFAWIQAGETLPISTQSPAEICYGFGWSPCRDFCVYFLLGVEEMTTFTAALRALMQRLHVLAIRNARRDT